MKKRISIGARALLLIGALVLTVIVYQAFTSDNKLVVRTLYKTGTPMESWNLKLADQFKEKFEAMGGRVTEESSRVLLFMIEQKEAVNTAYLSVTKMNASGDLSGGEIEKQYHYQQRPGSSPDEFIAEAAAPLLGQYQQN